MNQCRSMIVFLFISLFSIQSFAALNIAVASNFKVSAQHIAKKFTDESGIDVNISSASTTTLYQQILRGAPFDLFLAADKKHIELLVEKDKVGAQKEFAYATGRLVFWKPGSDSVPTQQDFMQYNDRLAIANPKFAPYGIAAKQALEFIKKWQAQEYVKGNNINQTYQFVDSKNVQAGLVSYAAMIQKKRTHFVIIPEEWHQPIQQSGIVLKGKHTQQAILFRQFLLSKESQDYIKSQGYN